uniref:Uncharacterized protein n=1 Tax=Tanacetum cinerariifolium TaxID=118510 RepID=A0A6L2MMK1_TANCI|nr:hypothetical protein [Tanacetum cinerariifolium]
MPELEDITYSDEEDDVGAEADFNNLETSITVSPIPTTRVHKDHPESQIIGDLSLTTQTRSMTRVVQDQGVNTPRCDEDRLELNVNDVTRLQDLVDKKKVVGTEATIRNVLHLDDAEVGGLSTHTTKYTSPALTQKVFANMRRVGKGFSRVETPLFEGMIVEQQVAEGDDEVHDEGVPVAVQPTPPQSPQAQPQSPQHQPQPSQDAGISMNLLQDLMDTCTALPRRFEHLELDKIAQALEITKLKRRVKKLEKRNKVKVLKLRRLKRVGSAQRIDTSDNTVMDDVSNQGRMIADMDADVDVVLEEAKDVAADAKDDQDAEVNENADIQGRTTESQAEIYKIDLDHANKVLSMQEEESEPVELQEVVDIVTTAKIITEIVTAAGITISAADVSVHAATTAVALTLTPAPSRRVMGDGYWAKLGQVNLDTYLLSKMKMLWLFLTYNFFIRCNYTNGESFEKAKAIAVVVEGDENHWVTSVNPFDF